MARSGNTWVRLPGRALADTGASSDFTDFLRGASKIKVNAYDFDDFLTGYTGCALWSSTDDDGGPLDGIYAVQDIAPESQELMQGDCLRFLEMDGVLKSIAEGSLKGGSEFTRAGQDFWLTRNRHGAGFWDGCWEAPYDQQLTKASHEFPGCDLFIGDDGLIHLS